ncbi:MAG: phytanoyl-CoA dioxygenase family protein [Pirellulaceae bacterium]
MALTGHDLSKIHSPISAIFEDHLASQSLHHFRLSEDQISHFHEHGYVAGIPVLSHPQIESLIDELTEFFQGDHAGADYWYEYNSNESTDPNTVLFHALGAWRIGNGFHDLLWNPAITVPASQLLGGSIRFWHDQLFCKPALHGGVVAWHQDYSYWTRTEPMAHLTCWIGLDDATTENGCLHYVPGSHKWELLPITGLAAGMESIKQELNDSQYHMMQNPVAIELKAGECSFHHPLMVHGSFENGGERPRRATVVNVVRDGVCAVSDEPLLDGTDPIPAGQPLNGQFYPLLLDVTDLED